MANAGFEPHLPSRSLEFATEPIGRPLSQAHSRKKRRHMDSRTDTYLGTFAEKRFVALQ